MRQSVLVLQGKTVDPIADALGRLYDTTLLADEPEFDKIEVAGFVMDCTGKTIETHATDKAVVDKSLSAGIPVVLLNVSDASYMASMCGFGFKTQCTLAYPYRDKLVLHVLDRGTKEAPQVEGSSTVTQSDDGTKQIRVVQHPDFDADLNALPSSTPFAELSPSAQAGAIEAILNSEDRHEDIDALMVMEQVGDTDDNLPSHQRHTCYLKLSRPIVEPCDQKSIDEVVMEVTLIASYDDPPYKYLRVRSRGAGFHPGAMCWNLDANRGWFQYAVWINMGCLTGPLSTLQTSPANTNNQTSYTTSSSFTVGVDVNKDPGFNPSYTVGQSTTTAVSDFDIKNDSSGLLGRWIWQLSMTKNSISDLFEFPIWKKGRVKRLPNLATSNLQAISTTIWYTDKTYSGQAQVMLHWWVRHSHCWVTGNWIECEAHCSIHGWGAGFFEGNPVSIDFSRVNAD